MPIIVFVPTIPGFSFRFRRLQALFFSWFVFPSDASARDWLVCTLFSFVIRLFVTRLKCVNGSFVNYRFKNELFQNIVVVSRFHLSSCPGQHQAEVRCNALLNHSSIAYGHLLGAPKSNSPDPFLTFQHPPTLTLIIQ
jgi:hypothetical protein